MSDIDSVFKEFDKAVPGAGSGGGRWLGIGESLVEILEVKCNPSQRSAAINYIVEFTLIESTIPNALADGTVYTWINDVTRQFFGMSNTKQFLSAAMGYTEKSAEALALGEADIKESFSDDQPLKGGRVRVRTFNKTSKSTGNDFTVHAWSPA